MSADLRAELLAWVEEQERVCAGATGGKWRLTEQLSGSENDRGWRLNAWQGRFGTWVADISPVIKGHRGDASEEGRANAHLLLAARSVLPLALAAIRGEVEAHGEAKLERRSMCACGDVYYPCYLLRRLHAALLVEKP